MVLILDLEQKELVITQETLLVAGYVADEDGGR
jgi:hypothetical protein